MGYIGASSRTLILTNCCNAMVIHLSIKKKKKKILRTLIVSKSYFKQGTYSKSETDSSIFLFPLYISCLQFQLISAQKTQVPIHAIQNIFSLYLYFITLLLKFSFFSLQCGDHHLPPSSYFKIIALKEIANYA